MTTTHLLLVNVHHGQHYANVTHGLDLETCRPTHAEIVAEIAEGIRRAREVGAVGAYVPDDDAKVVKIAETLTTDETTEHGWARYSITEV